MRARLSGVSKSHGAQIVLDHATLEVGPRARIGLVGPNGVGKSTVLRLLAGEETPDEGVVALDPPNATVAHLPQEPERRPGETLRARIARLTGVASAERALHEAGAALASDARDAADRYDAALARLLALGGGDLDARAAATCARLGLGGGLDRPFAALSGERRPVPRSPRFCSPGPTCCSSTSRRTTWTPTGSRSSRRSWSGSRARSSSSRTTGRSSTGR